MNLPAAGLVSVGLACLFVAGAGCGFLYQKSHIHTLGQQIRHYETRLEEAKRRRLLLDRTYASMCSPAGLDERVRRMNLGLYPPQPDQIVRLPEPSLDSPNAKLVARGAFAGTEGTN